MIELLQDGQYTENRDTLSITNESVLINNQNIIDVYMSLGVYDISALVANLKKDIAPPKNGYASSLDFYLYQLGYRMGNKIRYSSGTVASQLTPDSIEKKIRGCKLATLTTYELLNQNGYQPVLYANRTHPAFSIQSDEGKTLYFDLEYYKELNGDHEELHPRIQKVQASNFHPFPIQNDLQEIFTLLDKMTLFGILARYNYILNKEQLNIDSKLNSLNVINQNGNLIKSMIIAEYEDMIEHPYFTELLGYNF